jgi:hypothetical protein
MEQHKAFVGIDDAKQLWYFRIPKVHLGPSCSPTGHLHLVTERWPILSITPTPNGEHQLTLQGATGETSEIILESLGPTQLFVQGYNWSVSREPRSEATYLKSLFSRPEGAAVRDALQHLNSL